jgi:hypothetical protein
MSQNVDERDEYEQSDDGCGLSLLPQTNQTDGKATERNTHHHSNNSQTRNQLLIGKI